MRFSRVLGLAGLLALAIVLLPEILPTGPSTTLDPSKFLQSGQLLFAAGIIFLGGLATSLTPCVYPLIPITVGVFGARQAGRGRALLLTLAYINGMGIVFAVLGVIAAFSGKAFGSALGNPLVVAGLALFLIALAASMFGAFEIALPSSLATKLNGVGGSGILGAFLMGSVSGFLAAPCTGPTLFGVLTWVGQMQNPVLGGSLLYVYALGIGVPFFLIGVFTVRLPKGGVWMEWVKSFFGIALLALAVGYLRDAFPSVRSAFGAATHGQPRWVLISLAAAMVLGGTLLGAIHRSFKEGRVDFALKAVGVIALTLAIPLRMAPFHLNDSFRWTAELTAHGPMEKLDAVLAQAKADGKPVMIDFFAEWCAACKELDELTYPKAEVIAQADRFVTIKVDGTLEDDASEVLYKRFGVQGLPTVLFINACGEVLSDPKVIGFLPADKFVREQEKVPTHQALCQR
ncbi:MAG: thioredoxin family protein [Myxococcaceae bacterium]|nr:thioredoxin family protein [Myxococcaceae bacterium]